MHKILLTYTSFVIACVVVIAAFITATTYLQLAVAILLYPVMIFFAYKVLPLRSKRAVVKTDEVEFEPSFEPDEKISVIQRDSVSISDIDKRVFLKLIGGAGVFLFIFSIFNRKAEGLLFKSFPEQTAGSIFLKDPGGNKINPAQNQPTDGYSICEIEDDVISYYGYINKAGAWFVMKIDTDTGSFRYSKGNSNFNGNWGKREKLRYDYFNNVFNGL